MAVFDIYSKRQKRTAGNPVEVFQYDVMPETLRNQIVYILRDVIGNNSSYRNAYEVYAAIHDDLVREYGQEQLVEY
ncbi:MAG TPA: hypothetical protein VJA94_21645, partial [Candidatus Angelobacter sp.]